LKAVIQGKTLPDGLSDIQNGLSDIEHHMLHFLDNHDEQRLASPEFAGTPEKGKPMMPCENVVARLLLKNKQAKVVKTYPLVIKMLVETTDFKQELKKGLDAKNIQAL
jgi:hypothetical protein